MHIRFSLVSQSLAQGWGLILSNYFLNELRKGQLLLIINPVIFVLVLLCIPSMTLETFSSVHFSSVQSLSRVQHFVTPWIAARQASLSMTNSWGSLRLTSIELVMASSHLILCHPLFLLGSLGSFPNPSQHQSLFQWVNSSHEVAKVLEFQLQHHSFQNTPRADLL